MERENNIAVMVNGKIEILKMTDDELNKCFLSVFKKMITNMTYKFMEREYPNVIPDPNTISIWSDFLADSYYPCFEDMKSYISMEIEDEIESGMVVYKN